MKVQRLSRYILLALCSPGAAFAHSGGETALKPHNWEELAGAWEFEAGIIVPLLISAVLYGFGIYRLWRATHVGCGVSKAEAGAFAGGWLALVVALVSPLHPWGRVLFSAHMSQHEILMLVAAPLLVLGKPLVPFLKAVPLSVAKGIARCANTAGWQKFWRVASHAFVAWLLHAVILWLWHLPSLFQATIENDFVHALQHSSFLFSALLFWWAVLHGRQRSLGYGLAVLYLFTTAMHNGLLGVLLTVAGRTFYPAYNQTAPWWGLTPLEDQQLGGLIMWIPAGTIYLVAGVVLFRGWLLESERRVKAAPTPALSAAGGS
jgi:putative membrane protein